MRARSQFAKHSECRILRYNRRVYLFTVIPSPSECSCTRIQNENWIDSKWKWYHVPREYSPKAVLSRIKLLKGENCIRDMFELVRYCARTSLHGSESFVENLIYNQRLRSCRLRAMDYRLQVTGARYERSAGLFAGSNLRRKKGRRCHLRLDGNRVLSATSAR